MYLNKMPLLMHTLDKLYYWNVRINCKLGQGLL